MRPGASRISPLRLWLLAAACLFAVAGCGLRTYTERLNRTRRLQEYVDLLDRELVEQPWRNSVFRLRVPRQFSSPPGEKPAKLADDQRIPSGLRQFIKNLEGVQGVWHTTVRARGTADRQPAYVVLASNRDLTEGGRYTLKDARQYGERIIQAMHHACGQARPLRADWIYRELPEDREFAIRRTYAVFEVQAGSAGPEAAPYRLLAFCVNGGQHQFAVLYVLPANISEDEKLTVNERIGLSLGTLSEQSQ